MISPPVGRRVAGGPPDPPGNCWWSTVRSTATSDSWGTLSGAVTDLRVSSAVMATGIVSATDVLTAALRWTPPMNALTTTLRYSRTLITKANWASAALLTDTLPGAADIYTATVPYAGGVVYFALKPRNAVDESALSNNAFWPRREVYLPLVFK